MEQMQHLHGASSRSCLPVPALCFLVLWSVSAVPVTKKAHGGTAARPSGCPWVAAGGWVKPEAIQRGTCGLFLGGHRTAPFWGKEPPALGCRNSCLSGARGPPRLPRERQRRGSHVGWVPQAGYRAEGQVWWPLVPLLASTALIPLPRRLTCGFAGIPGCIPMNRELLSARGQLPSTAITPPSAWGEGSRQAGDTQLSLLQKFNNNNNKKVSVNSKKKMLSNTRNNERLISLRRRPFDFVSPFEVLNINNFQSETYRIEYFLFENCGYFNLKTSNETLEYFFSVVKTIHQNTDNLANSFS